MVTYLSTGLAVESLCFGVRGVKKQGVSGCAVRFKKTVKLAASGRLGQVQARCGEERPEDTRKPRETPT